MPRSATARRTPEIVELMRQRLCELSSLVESRELSSHEFFSRWLAVVSECAVSDSGAVLLRSNSGVWTEVATRNFACVALGSEDGPTAHGRLVYETFSQRRPRVVLPTQSEAEGDIPANTPRGLLLIAPFVARQQVRGVIELVLPADADADKQLETLAAVQAAGELIAVFEERQASLAGRRREQIAEYVESFCRQVYRDLSVGRTAYAIANEAKRLLGAERVSVLVRRGKTLRLVAVSGLDVVEKRSAAAKEMCAMAEAVNAGQEVAHYPPLEADGAEPLPPQLQKAVGDYVDHSYVRRISVLPLVAATPEAASQAFIPAGSLVVEWFGDADFPPGYVDRCRFAVEHAAAALEKARRYERLPGVKLWQRVADWRDSADPKRRWKLAAWLGVPFVGLLSLVFIPADFTIHSAATLQPALNQFAFAPSDGVVKQIFVKHGDRVESGQPLVQLRNVDLEVQITELTGRRCAAQEQLSGVERSLFEDSVRLPVAERHRLSGDRSKLRQELASFDEQLKLLERKREQLLVRSPLAGEVLTWDVEKLLLHRPVQIGQSLLEIGDVGGAWTLELELPDDDVGHVAAANQASAPLAVRYRLAAAPQEDYYAAVQEVHLAADVRGEAGNVVLVRASLNDVAPPVRRAGTAAVAKVYCGRRSLGYVWLHDAIDFLRTKVWFRLS